jgi:hypothetical protein
VDRPAFILSRGSGFKKPRPDMEIKANTPKMIKGSLHRWDSVARTATPSTTKYRRKNIPDENSSANKDKRLVRQVEAKISECDIRGTSRVLSSSDPRAFFLSYRRRYWLQATKTILLLQSLFHHLLRTSLHCSLSRKRSSRGPLPVSILALSAGPMGSGHNILKS